MKWGRQGVLREKEMKLNLPSADQHEVFFSDKSIERDLIAKHHLDNSFSLTASTFPLLQQVGDPFCSASGPCSRGSGEQMAFFSPCGHPWPIPLLLALAPEIAIN